MSNEDFMKKAIDLSRLGMQNNKGGPFGAIVVKGTEIVGVGYNMVNSTNDPTAHAELVAIRDACKTLGVSQLTGCIIYTSCEPCPMCLGAIYWARPDRVYYANNRYDAASIGFDDSFIYDELKSEIEDRTIPMIRISEKEAFQVFKEWKDNSDHQIF